MSLIRFFPIEMGTERTLIFDRKQFLQYLNSYNMRRNIYFSIYSSKNINDVGRLDFSDAVIDKVFFDFDGEDAFENAMKLHDYCLRNDFKHIVLFSGNKGFHVYVFTAPVFSGTKDFKKELILNCQTHLKEKLDLCSDSKVFGDVSRLGRVYNTYNIKGKRFCILLSKTDIEEGESFIRNKAKTQNKDFASIFGKTLLELDRSNRKLMYRTMKMSFEISVISQISKIEREIFDYLTEDNTLKFILSNKLVKHNMNKNDILFKNLAILLVQSGITDSDMYNITKKIVENCPGHKQSELLGWINKAKHGEIYNFNKSEINNWIKTHNLPIEPYKENELLV